jgi:hypothetical protein
VRDGGRDKGHLLNDFRGNYFLRRSKSGHSWIDMEYLMRNPSHPRKFKYPEIFFHHDLERYRTRAKS